MAALTWNEALALQQPRLDDTHREFVDLLCGVERALDAEDAATLAQALDAFVDHTEAHFAQEDRWMQQLGLGAGNCHSVQHAEVLELVHEVRRRLHDHADAGVVRALVPALAQWFPNHAMSMDAGLVQGMQEAGIDPDAEPLPVAAAAPG